jgi:hypothetical protein
VETENTKLHVVQSIHGFMDELEAGRKPPEKYPGVTKMLGGTSDKSFLIEWRNRIGDAEANRILTESHAIGNSLDKLVQLSFDDTFEQATHEQEAGYGLYRQLKKELQKVDPIALQLKVWSETLKVMGYLDIVGFYDGVLSLIDIKNTRTSKKREYVEDYFLQCTMYSMCIYDLLGIEIKQLVLLIGDRSSTRPQVFVDRTKNYVREAVRRSNQYHALTA